MFWGTGVLGFMFAISPFILGYSSNPAAMWTSLILGGAVVFLSVVEGAAHDKGQWEYVAAILAGIAAVIAPFIFKFDSHQVATWTTVGLGAVLVFLAGSRLFVTGTDISDNE